jgi:antitoxin (DNA-binding transcriptional repressor) of toxin-antitoxin stability system
MKYVSTAELKAKLSQHLGEVREGAVVYVTSHGHPVAELSRIKGDGGLEIQKPEGVVADLLKLKIRPVGGASAEANLYADRGRR